MFVEIMFSECKLRSLAWGSVTLGAGRCPKATVEDKKGPPVVITLPPAG